jgi:hypothetical protein
MSIHEVALDQQEDHQVWQDRDHRHRGQAAPRDGGGVSEVDAVLVPNGAVTMRLGRSV